MAIIKTPDQRVRVFISSTINELAEERKAAREAIENLRLIPVFFEAGARPHPPRDLYSAYLDQSHIFLGIYWNSYGWVAPGSSISGLEDEYRLCGNKRPKLIYVKRSNDRQPELNNLLKDIEKSETACYQLFTDAEELGKLIENDLSVLMSEIFENAFWQDGGEEEEEKIFKKMEELPAIRSEIIGREEDLTRLSDLLIKKEVRLITILGAGGTGKTTLSIHLAHLVKEGFTDGVAFISLAPVTDHKLVATTMAGILGIQDSGKQAVEQSIIEFLADKNALLVLDNFEQVIDAIKIIGDIINHCPMVKLVITSRTSLHIRQERIYNLSTLQLPDDSAELTSDQLAQYSATKLFIDRSLEVNPKMELNKENTKAILEICRRMDGLPLAIELAAARTKFFQPAALMNRIDKTLDLVSKGMRDLPERQKTLRAAIEWSYNLLSDELKQAFRQLGIFKRSWTLEAADTILKNENNTIDIEELTERLLDVSLIKPTLVNHTSEPRFNMLQTVHEYAHEELEKSADAENTKKRYAQYFYDLCVEAYPHLWIGTAEAWLDKIEFEYQNIRAAFYILLELNEYEKAWHFIYLLSPYWTVRGGFSESKDWIEACGMHNEEIIKSDLIAPVIKGRSLVWAGYCQLFMFDFEHGFSDIELAEKLLEAIPDDLGLVYAYLFDGGYGSYLQKPGSAEKIEKGVVLADKVKDPMALGMYYLWCSEYYRQINRIDIVYENFDKARKLAMQHGIKYISGALNIVEFNFELLNPQADWNKVLEKGHAMYKMLPEKGYKGLKGAAKSIISYALIKLNRIEESERPLIQSLEYSRLSGEMESHIYGVMQASWFFKLKGNEEKAYTLFGALDQFITSSHYPLIGGSEVQYNETKKALHPDLDHTQNKLWYEEGKRMTLLEGVVYALVK
ncbi:MAG: DUF4062 domain-containing protein [Saprospiraceae bacterium]|nr:DUF4062 domain-containing protein [Saprospiraceae bacterium]